MADYDASNDITFTEELPPVVQSGVVETTPSTTESEYTNPRSNPPIVRDLSSGVANVTFDGQTGTGVDAEGFRVRHVGRRF